METLISLGRARGNVTQGWGAGTISRERRYLESTEQQGEGSSLFWNLYMKHRPASSSDWEQKQAPLGTHRNSYYVYRVTHGAPLSATVSRLANPPWGPDLNPTRAVCAFPAGLAHHQLLGQAPLLPASPHQQSHHWQLSLCFSA